MTDPRIGDLIRQRARIGALIRQARIGALTRQAARIGGLIRRPTLPWRGHWLQGSGLHGPGQRPRFALSPGLA